MSLLVTWMGVLVLAGCSAQVPSPAGTAQSNASDAMLPMTSSSPAAVTAFRKGEMLMTNSRNAEAAAAFQEATRLDPNFVLAKASHGSAMPGAAGAKELEAAAAAASKLPEAERAYVEGIVAVRRNDTTAAQVAFSRVTQLAARDWRGYYALGMIALNNQRYGEAVDAFKKAVGRDPKAAAGAQNMIGYAALRQEDTDQAIAALQAYARALPQEPNPQDSLGEALLAAGRFREAEAAFQKALQLSPQFWNAYEGIAYVRFYQGDWAGGREALQHAQQGAPDARDRIGVQQTMAAAAVAQWRTSEAMQVLDAAEKTPGAEPGDAALIAVNRGYTLIAARRYQDAAAAVNAAMKIAEGGALPPGVGRTVRRQALIVRATAAGELGDAAAAKTASASLDADASARPQDPLAESSMHFGHAMLALASKDAAGAKMHFEQCSREDEYCHWQSIVVAEKAADKATAAAMRQRVLKTYKRTPLHLVVRSRVAPAPVSSTQ